MSRGNFTACPGRWEPSGRLLFPAPDDWGTRTAAGGFALTGRRYSLEIKRRVALCGARESAAPAAGAKRKGHLRFPFLFGLLPFPCQLVWRRSETGDRFENRGTAVGLPQRVFLNLFAGSDTLLLHLRFHLCRRNIPVSRNSLTCYNG